MKLVISVCSLATTVAEMQFECLNVFHRLVISVEMSNELLLGQFSILCFSARACNCPDVHSILSCSINFKHFGDKNSSRLSLSTSQSSKLITKCSPKTLIIEACFTWVLSTTRNWLTFTWKTSYSTWLLMSLFSERNTVVS